MAHPNHTSGPRTFASLDVRIRSVLTNAPASRIPVGVGCPISRRGQPLNLSKSGTPSLVGSMNLYPQISSMLQTRRCKIALGESDGLGINYLGICDLGMFEVDPRNTFWQYR
jgi:hypothetical protein